MFWGQGTGHRRAAGEEPGALVPAREDPAFSRRVASAYRESGESLCVSVLQRPPSEDPAATAVI